MADTSRDEDRPELNAGSMGGCGANVLPTYNTAITSSAWMTIEPTTPSG
jgi:hypothetical protein